MAPVQLNDLQDSSNSNSADSSGMFITLLFSVAATILVVMFVGTMLLSAGVSSAVAAKHSTSTGSFLNSAVLNTIVTMLVILSLVFTVIHYDLSRDAEDPPTLATFSVILVVLAILYKFAFPFDMGVRRKIMVHLILLHVIYWGGWWIFPPELVENRN